MAHVVLVHWRPEEAAPHVAALREAGHEDLSRRFPAATKAMGDPGALWILWPKKASAVRRLLRKRRGV